MVERDKIYERVVELVRPLSKNRTAVENISEDTSILEDLQVNSARLVDLILAFEDEFNIEVDDDAADSVRTIGDAVDMLAKQLS
ncbi:MAG: phosphopantetheine-binding protein [Thermoanaerobaculia bacterium]|jgi:acyl carrier protein